eukprot:g928.t1
MKPHDAALTLWALAVNDRGSESRWAEVFRAVRRTSRPSAWSARDASLALWATARAARAREHGPSELATYHATVVSKSNKH